MEWTSRPGAEDRPLPADVSYLLTKPASRWRRPFTRLVHRDIKPANIHIGRMGLRHDYVKVLVSGLVKWSPTPRIRSGL